MAPGSDTWTNGNADRQWDEPLNWLGGDIPGDGHTATFASVVDMPNANLPGGITVNYVFTAGITTTISGMVGAASAIGAVTVNHVNTDITAGANITGAITLTNGVLRIAAARTLGGTVAIGSLGGLYLDASGTVVASDTITMSAGSLLDNASGTVLDIAATKSLTGTATRIDNAGTIQGTVNMTACEWVGDGIITVDEDGTLNLGTDADNDQSVDVAADVTIGDHFTCYGFDGSSGAITGADKTITVGAGGLDWGAATLAVAGELNITFAETTTTCKWGSTTHYLGTATINAGVSVTSSGATYLKKLTGGATATLNIAAQALQFMLPAANFWDFDGTCTGTTGALGAINVTADIAVAKIIDIGLAEFRLLANAHTLTLSAGLTCDNLTVRGYGAGTTGTLVTGGPLTVATNLTLGDAVSNSNGILTMAAGEDNSIGGTVARAGTGTGHGLNLAGRVTFGGNVTLAEITPDFGSAYVSGAVTIDGADAGTVANTRAVITQATVTNLTAPAANPVYVYHHDSQTLIADSRLPRNPSTSLNGVVDTGNTNVTYVLVTYDGLGHNRRAIGIRARGRRTTPIGGRRRHLARGRP